MVKTWQGNLRLFNQLDIEEFLEEGEISSYRDALSDGDYPEARELHGLRCLDTFIIKRDDVRGYHMFVS